MPFFKKELFIFTVTPCNKETAKINSLIYYCEYTCSESNFITFLYTKKCTFVTDATFELFIYLHALLDNKCTTIIHRVFNRFSLWQVFHANQEELAATKS